MSTWIQDGGHGGTDGGASANGIVEKVYTLEASLYVNKRLREHGIRSDVTRTEDVGMSNNTRTTIVKRYDRCISHHYNAGGGHGAEFIKSIHSNGRFERLLVDAFKNAGYPLRTNAIYNRTLPSNKKLDYYFMHRQTGNTRTTIVEYEFLDGKNQGKIKSKSYRVGMYEAVVKSVCEEEKVKYIKPNEVKNKDTFYRVVTGSFNDKSNADKRVAELKKKGFDSFIDVYKK